MQTLITSPKLIVLFVAAMLLVVAAPYNSNAQGLQSDEFDGSGQNLQSFWEVQNTFWHVQQGNEGSYMLSDGNLVVEGAFYQNLWDADYTRRFYQVTDQEKFSVETSFIFDHKDVCAVAGLAIKSPTQNEWVTLKMWGYGIEDPWGGSGNTAVIQFQHRELHLHNVTGYNPPGGNIPTALRLDRDGDTYTAWYKPDAQGEWVYTGETTVALQGPLEVGIFTGICQDEAPGGLTVTFDYFRATTDATELAQQAQAGPKIEGPWLWTIVPIGDRSGEQAIASGIDFLADASQGSVTETAIATEGASAGDPVGSKRWTPGKIAPTGGNNMNDLVNAIGLGIGDVDYHVAYGSITLESPSEQGTTMYVGSDDTVRVWLNGALVHTKPHGGAAFGYQNSFPISLRQGKNILLVAVYESWGGWSGFFGFEDGTTYTVVPPEMPTTPVDMAQPVDVLIYTNLSAGIDVPDAEMAAETTRNLLEAEGISVEITKDGAFVRDWMLQTTNDGKVNVLVLYGVLPASVYAEGNGSIAENWIETTDGNTILNHAEYIGYYVDVGTGNRNWDTVGVHGLQNLMDNPNITSFIHGQGYDDPLPMIVTSDGTAFTPSLANFGSYRPISLNQLRGRWFAEKVFASDTGNAQATYADPVIVRDGNLGRLAILHSSNQPAESKSLPNGEVAAEIISNYLLNEDAPTTVVPPEKPTTPPVSPVPNYSQIYVDAANGVNAPTGRGSADKPYKTITFALLISERNKLSDPWQVLIRPGTYVADPLKPQLEREVFPIKLRNNMIFSGTTNAAECIIDAQHLDSSTVPILNGFNVGGVTIQNLTIRNMNRTEHHGGIDLWDHTNEITTPNQILSCVIHNNHPNGVGTNMPLVLANNTISDNRRNGVWSNTNVSATHNIFSGNVEMGVEDWRIQEGALHIDGDSSGDIFGNTFQNIESDEGHVYIKGVRVTGTLEGKVSDNTFTGAGDGISLGEFRGDFTNNVCSTRLAGISIGANFIGNVSHNTFSNHRAYGMYLHNFTGNISHNTFTDSNGGFYIRESITGNIAYNKFISNTDLSATWQTGGGFLVGNLSGNITHNLFAGNSAAGAGAFVLQKNSTNEVKVSNNIFVNNRGTQKGSGDPSNLDVDAVGDAVITRHNTHFINNLFLTASDKLVTDAPDTSAVVPAGGTVWLKSPGCRFHNNIFSGGHTAIFIKGNHDLPITHNLFHSNILNTFVNQAGNAYGIELEIWELFATNASDNIVAKVLLIEPGEDRDYRLQNPGLVIDAGTNEFTPADDYNGDARPVGGTVDIGPYEYPEETEDVTLVEAPAWDVNEDGHVNILDLVLVSRFFGLSDFRANPRVDVNDDGSVNILDLVVVAGHFGESTGASAPAGAATPANIDAGTVQAWIQQAQVADDGSAVFREGIANLKQLLAVSTPQKTALLANYPNPFNPETWIPYQLANPADVSITIYAADGKLAKTLTLGHQAVGKYHDRSRAAYWDGKNAQGESVASGVYFYTLTAGDFSATRKMLILK